MDIRGHRTFYYQRSTADVHRRPKALNVDVNMLSLRLPTTTGFLEKNSTTRAWFGPILRHASRNSRSYFRIVGSINQKTLVPSLRFAQAFLQSCRILTSASRGASKPYWTIRHQSARRYVLYTKFLVASLTEKSYTAFCVRIWQIDNKV
jgi:hypothetical protein